MLVLHSVSLSPYVPFHPPPPASIKWHIGDRLPLSTHFGFLIPFLWAFLFWSVNDQDACISQSLLLSHCLFPCPSPSPACLRTLEWQDDRRIATHCGWCGSLTTGYGKAQVKSACSNHIVLACICLPWPSLLYVLFDVAESSPPHCRESCLVDFFRWPQNSGKPQIWPATTSQTEQQKLTLKLCINPQHNSGMNGIVYSINNIQTHSLDLLESLTTSSASASLSFSCKISIMTRRTSRRKILHCTNDGYNIAITAVRSGPFSDLAGVVLKVFRSIIAHRLRVMCTTRSDYTCYIAMINLDNVQQIRITSTILLQDHDLVSSHLASPVCLQ